jgi:hypothetical protein
MPLSQQFDSTPAGAESLPEPGAVRAQLRRLLAHPLFTNSKRYPVLLAYVVEQSLLGNAGELKERTIGVEAFGREPAYDVNLDPIVRMTAAEVRKRLSQYYYAAEHAGQLIIELPLGSYVPTFREPESRHAEAAVPHADPAFPAAETPALVDRTQNQPVWRRRMALAAALLAALLIGFGTGQIRLPRQPSNLERFWEPITSTSSRVTYCLGEPTEPVDRNRAPDGGLSPVGSLNVSDVITLARSIEPIVPRNGAYRVVAASATQFTQLREGPDVMIGAFDNLWALRITQDLPYGFRVDDGLRKIVDRSNPRGTFWTLRWLEYDRKLATDYAVVARIHDNTTGQPVILLAGILGEGTEAAGELVSTPAYLDALLARAPRNWDKLNLEAVIETQVIDGHPGPPKVVALRTW